MLELSYSIWLKGKQLRGNNFCWSAGNRPPFYNRARLRPEESSCFHHVVSTFETTPLYNYNFQLQLTSNFKLQTSNFKLQTSPKTSSPTESAGPLVCISIVKGPYSAFTSTKTLKNSASLPAVLSAVNALVASSPVYCWSCTGLVMPPTAMPLPRP